MKSVAIFLLSFLIQSNIWSQQDTIITFDGRHIPCRVTSTDSVKIYCKVLNNYQFEDLILRKDQVERIIYDKTPKYNELLHKNVIKMYGKIWGESKYKVGSQYNFLFLNYERVFNKQTSFLLFLGFPSSKVLFDEDARSDYRTYLNGIEDPLLELDGTFKHSLSLGASFSGELRHYFDTIAINPKGLYAGGGISYLKVTQRFSFAGINSSTESLLVNNKINQVMLYLSFGYQFVPINFLTFDLCIKPALRIDNKTDILNKKSTEGILNVNFYIGIGINY
jgi:hypothetical protein